MNSSRKKYFTDICIQVLQFLCLLGHPVYIHLLGHPVYIHLLGHPVYLHLPSSQKDFRSEANIKLFIFS